MRVPMGLHNKQGPAETQEWVWILWGLEGTGAED